LKDLIFMSVDNGGSAILLLMLSPAK
jgi:hypothetical protein